MLNGGGAPGHVLGPVASMLRAVVVNGFVRERLRLIPHEQKREQLLTLTALIEAGKLTPVLDRTYPLADTAEAAAAWNRDTHAARLSSPWRRPARGPANVLVHRCSARPRGPGSASRPGPWPRRRS